MKHLIAEQGLSGAVSVDSAGTGAWHAGEPADARARQAATARGYRLDSIARKVRRQDFDSFDYIVAMDRDNFANLERMAPDDQGRAKLSTLRSFDEDSPADSEVPDPYYGGDDGFNEVLDICEAGCRGLLARIRMDRGL